MSRYGRQESLPEIGKEGQHRLAGSVVAIVGVGALGSVSAELLARAGIGTLILIDYDIVEHSNLQRQALFVEEDVGSPKATAAALRLSRINSEILVEARVAHLNQTTIGLLEEADVTLDGTDNFQTRLLLNDFALKRGKIFVHAAAEGTRGSLYVVTSDKGRPCLRCIIGEKTNSTGCDQAGILNAASHTTASHQVAETVKVLLGKKPDVHYLSIDVWDHSCLSVCVTRRAGCMSCAGAYPSLKDATGTLDYCRSRACIKASPLPGGLDLNRIRELNEVKVIADYGSHALRCSIGGIDVLAHQVGAIEINTRDMQTAERIVKKIREKN